MLDCDYICDLVGISGGVYIPVLAILVTIGIRTLDTSLLVRQDHDVKCITVEFNFSGTTEMVLPKSSFFLIDIELL